MISSEDLEKLEKLSRLKITYNREKFFQDLEKIIAYFNELKEVDTKNVVLEKEIKEEFLKNVFQKENKENIYVNNWYDLKQLKDQFFEEEDDYLKIPSIFE